MNTINKKLLILPICLIAGVVITSVLATGTNVTVQSMYRDQAALVQKNQEMTEKIESASSLTAVNQKVPTLGFSAQHIVSITGGATALSMK